MNEKVPPLGGGGGEGVDAVFDKGLHHGREVGRGWHHEGISAQQSLQYYLHARKPMGLVGEPPAIFPR